MTDTPVTMTLRVGRISHSWHAAHATMTVMTFGSWGIIWVAHVVISALIRPTMTVEIPPGSRIEWRDGFPNVLAEDEYLTPPTTRERLAPLVWLIPVAVLLAVTVAVKTAWD